MLKNKKDLTAGTIFGAIAIFFFVSGNATLQMGSAHQMGPGYFPALASIVLGLFAIAILVRGFVKVPDGDGATLGEIPWRGVVLLTIAPIVFGLTVKGLGLVPSMVLTLLISSFASVRMGVVQAILLSAGLAAFCVLVFGVGIGIPLRYFGPWLGF